jgi:putative oxidoreductase
MFIFNKGIHMSLNMQIYLALLGRLLLASLFLISGIGKVTGFAATIAYIQSKGLPMAELGATAAAALEIGAATALVLGWKTRWVAFLLTMYTLATAILFHHFWTFAPPQLAVQQVQFLKNISIIGGLLSVMAWGPGDKSLDARKTINHLKEQA